MPVVFACASRLKLALRLTTTCTKTGAGALVAVHVPQQMCGIEGTGEGLMGDLLGLDVFLGSCKFPGAIVGPNVPHTTSRTSLVSDRWSYRS